MAKLIQTESMYVLNKNRKQTHALGKYHEFIERQERIKVKEFHREKLKLKKFLHGVQQSSGCYEEATLAGLIPDEKDSDSQQKLASFRTLSVLKQSGTSNKDCTSEGKKETISRNSFKDSMRKADESSISSDKKEFSSLQREKTQNHVVSQIQARAKSLGGLQRKRSSISSHYSTLADTLNSKVRVNRSLSINQSNRDIFPQFQTVEGHLNFGFLLKQRSYSLPDCSAQSKTRVRFQPRGSCPA